MDVTFVVVGDDDAAIDFGDVSVGAVKWAASMTLLAPNKRDAVSGAGVSEDDAVAGNVDDGVDVWVRKKRRPWTARRRWWW